MTTFLAFCAGGTIGWFLCALWIGTQRTYDDHYGEPLPGDDMADIEALRRNPLLRRQGE